MHFENDRRRSLSKEMWMVVVAEEDLVNHVRTTPRNEQASRCRHCCASRMLVVDGQSSQRMHLSEHPNDAWASRVLVSLKKWRMNPYAKFKWLTPVPLKRRCGTPTDAFTAMVAHRPLSSAMHNNDDNHWLVNSLALSFRDLRGLPLRRLLSPVPCSMIFSSVSWRQTWPNHDNLRRLSDDNKY